MKTITIEFTRVNNDVNGNPRYVCHFFNLLKDNEGFSNGLSISQQYDISLQRARKIGGKKFHNKQYGGGIVFQAVSTQELENKIVNLLNN